MGWKEPNNYNFIATYLYCFPGSSSHAVREALFFHRQGQLLGYSRQGSYSSYFVLKGQGLKYWYAPQRGKWILTLEGIGKVWPDLIKKIQVCRKICADPHATG